MNETLFCTARSEKEGVENRFMIIKAQLDQASRKSCARKLSDPKMQQMKESIFHFSFFSRPLFMSSDELEPEVSSESKKG